MGGTQNTKVLTFHLLSQGRRKQSADGQARLDVDSETVIILVLASYSAVRQRSHCTSVSNWGLPLLCFLALQGNSSWIKS